jgi:hypothetical protein
MAERHTLGVWVSKTAHKAQFFDGARIDSRLTWGVAILQYADEIVIYAAGNILQSVRGSLQKFQHSVDAMDRPKSDEKNVNRILKLL